MVIFIDLNYLMQSNLSPLDQVRLHFDMSKKWLCNLICMIAIEIVIVRGIGINLL